MKWFFGFVLVIALITGALYGVGRFLLPNALSVTRDTTIERPRAAVFAMVNDLQIAKEWSPYYARDPDAEYVFSGEGPGQGQSRDRQGRSGRKREERQGRARAACGRQGGRRSRGRRTEEAPDPEGRRSGKRTWRPRGHSGASAREGQRVGGRDGRRGR